MYQSIQYKWSALTTAPYGQNNASIFIFLSQEFSENHVLFVRARHNTQHYEHAL